MTELTRDQYQQYHEGYPTIKTLTETLPLPMIDEVSTTVTYYGYAELGTPVGAAKWKIIRVTKASATTPYGVITTDYADGNVNYDNVWSGRTGLSYSR